MAVVRDIISYFTSRGVPAYWEDTAGGCMAVRVEFGPYDNRGQQCHWAWITGRDDNFGRDDKNGANDDLMAGFLACIYFADAEGERIENQYGSEIMLYHSDDVLLSAEEMRLGAGEALPPGCFPVDLSEEARKVCEHVMFAVMKADYAERDGRDHAVSVAAAEWELSW